VSGPLWTLLVVAAGVALVVFATLKLRLPAFFALLLTAIAAGIAFGAEPVSVLASVKKGAGEALGFVAVILGLGSIFGALLEAGGGVGVMARALLDRFGVRRAPWALATIGILVGIPLFFDVALIILAPLMLGVAQRSGKAVAFVALPVLAGLAVMHGLLPPHPGPVAAAELLHADYGRIALWGLACGIPAVLVAGPLYALVAFRKGSYVAPETSPVADDGAADALIGLWPALVGMLAPLVLIVAGAVAHAALPEGPVRTALEFFGHPFVALAVACGYAWVLLRRRGVDRHRLLGIAGRALEPAGAIALVIGAGAAFKQVLIDSGAGAHLTAAVEGARLSPLVFGFLIAAIMRIAQGSATVAMVAAAGLAAPLATAAGLDANQVALVVIGIGAGATVVSHINDAGFWLVGQYLGLSETDTFRSWTVASTMAGLVAFGAAALASALV